MFLLVSDYVVLRSFLVNLQVNIMYHIKSTPSHCNALQLNYLAINQQPTATVLPLVIFQLILVSDNLVVSEAPCLPLCG